MTYSDRLMAIVFSGLFLLLAACHTPMQSGTADFNTDRCGGIAGLTCDAGQVCLYSEGECAVADKMGVCRPAPQLCTMDYSPVCGCDGKTYSNACTATSLGVSLAHQGACPGL